MERAAVGEAQPGLFHVTNSRIVAVLIVALAIITVIIMNNAPSELYLLIIFGLVLIVVASTQYYIWTLRHRAHLSQMKTVLLKQVRESMQACRCKYDELNSSLSRSREIDKNAREIIGDVDTLYGNLKHIFEQSIIAMERDSDVLALERDRDTIMRATESFRVILGRHKETFSELMAEQERKRIMRSNIDNKSVEFWDKMRRLEQTYARWGLSRFSAGLSDRFRCLYTSTVSEIDTLQGERPMMELTNKIDAQFEQISAELSEKQEVVSGKHRVLESVQDITEKIDEQFFLIAEQMNAVENIDDGADTKLAESFKMKICGWQEELVRRNEKFRRITDGINESIIAAEDGSNDTQLIANAAEVCRTYSEKLNKFESEYKSVFSEYKGLKCERKLASEMQGCSREIGSKNELLIFKLPVVLVHQDVEHSFRHFSVGSPDQSSDCNSKVIMMVGKTGAGKSLMINNIVNYVYGVSFSDNFRFQLIVEDEEIADRDGRDDSASMGEAESMTSWVSSFTLHHMEGFRIPYTLILVDTPGFGDTRGVAFDEKIVDSIKMFFSDGTHAINELSSIGFVMQASEARLTAEQIYIFKAVLNIFGKDVVENMSFLFTFADAQPPPAENTVRKELKTIPVSESAFFKFNNSAVYASTDDESNAYYWKFGVKSLHKFFDHIDEVIPVSLSLTKEVLIERKKLYDGLDTLQKQIKDGLDRLMDIERLTRTVNQLTDKMKTNENIASSKAIHHITSTCSSDCGTVDGCSAMEDGKCVKCPGECSRDAHTEVAKEYGSYPMTSDWSRVMKNVLFRYKVTLTDRRTKVNALVALRSEYKTQKNSLFISIQEACEATKRLEEISLGQSVLTSVAYIERLIDFERSNSRPNKQYRIEQLQHFKGRAEALCVARGGTDAATEKKDLYEKYVMEEIDRAMEDVQNEKHSPIIEAIERGINNSSSSEPSLDEPNNGLGYDFKYFPPRLGSQTISVGNYFQQRQTVSIPSTRQGAATQPSVQIQSMSKTPPIATPTVSSAPPKQKKDDVSMLMAVGI